MFATQPSAKLTQTNLPLPLIIEHGRFIQMREINREQLRNRFTVFSLFNFSNNFKGYPELLLESWIFPSIFWTISNLFSRPFLRYHRLLDEMSLKPHAVSSREVPVMLTEITCEDYEFLRAILKKYARKN
jgi:hypothetical protein